MSSLPRLETSYHFFRLEKEDKEQNLDGAQRNRGVCNPQAQETSLKRLINQCSRLIISRLERGGNFFSYLMPILPRPAHH